MHLDYYVYIILGFLAGSIMFSYLLPKLIKGVDVVSLSEDHNPGMANALKLTGLPVGLTCLLLDLAKGFVPSYLAMKNLNPGFWMFALVVLAPVAGHAFSPWLKGKGGKAIAVSFGVLLGLLPQSHLVFWLAALYLFFSVVVVISPTRARTVMVFALFSIVCVLFGRQWIRLGGVLICGIVVYKNLAAVTGESRVWMVCGKKIIIK